MVKKSTARENKSRHTSLVKGDCKTISFKNPTHFYLHDKCITDITNIPASESLSVLYLHNNSIQKIENLDSAVNLKSLYLQKNKISKIQNLGHLKNLQKLYLGHNEITVVEGLEDLRNLEELHIEKQRMNDGDSLCFDPRTIKNMAENLHVLNISHNNIDTVDSLRPLKYIKVVNISYNKLTNIKEVCDTICDWYYLTEATFMGNPIAKQHRYRENIIANTTHLSLLDNKEISSTTRCFIKRFEQEKLKQSSKHSITIFENLPSVSKNYPPHVQKMVSQSILCNTQPCLDNSALHNNASDVYLPWKALPKCNVGKNFTQLLKKQKRSINSPLLPEMLLMIRK